MMNTLINKVKYWGIQAFYLSALFVVGSIGLMVVMLVWLLLAKAFMQSVFGITLGHF